MIHCRLSDGHTVQVNSPTKSLFAEIDPILPEVDFIGCQCSGTPHFCGSSRQPTTKVSSDEILKYYDCFGEKFGYASLAWSGRIIQRVLWHCAGVCGDGFSADDVLTIFWAALDQWGLPEAIERRESVSVAGERFREHMEDGRRFFQSLPDGEEKFRMVDAENDRMRAWLAPTVIPGRGGQQNSFTGDFASAARIADCLGKCRKAFSKEIERWRETASDSDFVEVQNQRRNSPRYLYRVEVVLEHFQ